MELEVGGKVVSIVGVVVAIFVVNWMLAALVRREHTRLRRMVRVICLMRAVFFLTFINNIIHLYLCLSAHRPSK